MSFRIGINHYIYYNGPITQNNAKYKKKNPIEIKSTKIYNIGEKNE
ncbi:MAG: hypothetical protein ACFE9Y_01885 [Promethearchaeota archaeon]